MVDNKHDAHQDDIEIDPEHETNDAPELEEVEEHSDTKIKLLRDKLKESESKRQQLHEELQRTKADFLNAKHNLQADAARQVARATIKHVEQLLPLYDSFYLAMHDRETWEKADSTWRKGVEGIFSQLRAILEQLHVKAFDPTGELFDPHQHEAVSNVTVPDKSQHDKIVSVIQLGFERKTDETTELIRPARVAVGVFEA